MRNQIFNRLERMEANAARARRVLGERGAGRLIHATRVLGRVALILLGLVVANVRAQTNSIGLPKIILERRSQFDAKSKTARDPFFPDSTRRGGAPAAPAGATVTAPVVPMAKPEELLVLKGILGSAGRRMALINQKVFSAGMEADVQTDAGPVKVKCLEISSKSVVITVNDGPKTRELRLRAAP